MNLNPGERLGDWVVKKALAARTFWSWTGLLALFSTGGISVVQDTVGSAVARCAATAISALTFPKDYGGNTVATWTFDMHVVP